MKNWAGFYEELMKEQKNNEQLLSQTSEPYQQWEHKEVRTVILEMINEYLTFLNSIKNDLEGVAFLQKFEKKLNEYAKKNSQAKNADEKRNTKAQCNMIARYYNEFVKFRQIY